MGDNAERTQVVRPGQPQPDQGPDRTQIVQPPQGGFNPSPPQGPPSGGFNPGGPPQGPPSGGFNPGGPPQGPPPGGFNPGGPGGPGGPGQGGFNPGGPPQGGFQQGGPGGYQQGGFNPGGPQQGYGPGGPQQGGFGPPQGGFGPPQGGGGPGFGPAATDQDKMVAWGAAGSAGLIGLIVLIANLSVIGYAFALTGLYGVLLLLAVVSAGALLGGGVLIFMRNRLGPLLGVVGAAGIVVTWLLAIIVVLADVGIFSGTGIVWIILAAIPAVLCLMPQTRRYASGGTGPQLPGSLQLPGQGGQGGQGPGPQQGQGYGRPF